MNTMERQHPCIKPRPGHQISLHAVIVLMISNVLAHASGSHMLTVPTTSPLQSSSDLQLPTPYTLHQAIRGPPEPSMQHSSVTSLPLAGVVQFKV